MPRGYKSPYPKDGKRTCTLCGEEKPFDQFVRRASSPIGVASHCRVCASNRFTSWRKKNLDEVRLRDRISHYVSTYGISKAEAKSMAIDRTGICEICKETAPLVIDHHHESGLVRDKICRFCNGLLGYARENVEILDAAITYLRKHHGEK